MWPGVPDVCPAQRSPLRLTQEPDICGDEWGEYASDERHWVLGLFADRENARLSLLGPKRPVPLQRTGGGNLPPKKKDMTAGHVLLFGLRHVTPL